MAWHSCARSHSACASHTPASPSTCSLEPQASGLSLRRRELQSRQFPPKPQLSPLLQSFSLATCH
ncbi:hypothetical protein P7K49_039358, partial [Saguinus oedipus]